MDQKIIDYKQDDNSKTEDSIIMKIAKVVTVLVVLYVIIFY
jgi:hypothetical protein